MSRPDPARGDSRVGLTGIRRGPVDASAVWREFDASQAPADPSGNAFRGIHEEPEPAKDWHKEIEALQAQFAAEREEAYQKGLRDGQAAGEAAGRAMAEAAHEAKLRQVEARLGTRAEAVERALGGLFLDYEARILELAMAVARRIVGDSVQAPGTAALHAARLAVRKLGSETRVVVRVHPSDAPELEREQAIWSRSGRRVEFVADPSVGRGGVLVETDAGSIDARIPRMTERVEQALAQAFAEESERNAS